MQIWWPRCSTTKALNRNENCFCICKIYIYFIQCHGWICIWMTSLVYPLNNFRLQEKNLSIVFERLDSQKAGILGILDAEKQIPNQKIEVHLSKLLFLLYNKKKFYGLAQYFLMYSEMYKTFNHNWHRGGKFLWPARGREGLKQPTVLRKFIKTRLWLFLIFFSLKLQVIIEDL